jgi:hypothetical protein
MDLLVHEVLEKVEKAKTKPAKIKVLLENESWALKDVIRGSMDSKVVWLVPSGTPPYTPSKPESAPTNLLRENTKFAYFVQGPPESKIPAFKREQIFIGMLEGIHPKDAEVVIDMIAKKTPKGLTRPIVKEAFPGLLSDE